MVGDSQEGKVAAARRPCGKGEMKKKRISVLLIEPVRRKRLKTDRILSSPGLIFFGRRDYREIFKRKVQDLKPDVVVLH